MNKYTTIGAILLIIAFIGAFIIDGNNSSKLEQKLLEPQSIEEVGQVINSINQQLSGLYASGRIIEEKIQELEKEKRYWDGYLETKLNDLGIKYNPDQEIPQGALGKDMDGNEIATMYIPGGKPLPPVYGNTPEKRFQNFVRYYAQGFDETVFIEARNKYGVKEELLACISWAETTLGNSNKSKSNIMNYGNNDGGAVRHYEDVLANVMASAHGIAQGKMMGGNNIIGEMNGGSRLVMGLPTCLEAQAPNKCYATSGDPTVGPPNWRRNVHNCLTFIHGEAEDRDHLAIKNDLLVYDN